MYAPIPITTFDNIFRNQNRPGLLQTSSIWTAILRQERFEVVFGTQIGDLPRQLVRRYHSKFSKMSFLPSKLGSKIVFLIVITVLANVNSSR